MVQRLVYRTRCTYRTASNKQRVVRTPGNRLLYQHVNKAGSPVRCSETKKPLNGIPALRSVERRRIPKCQRKVSRAYGGNKSPKVVRDRILRAFLYEEKRCVQQVLAALAEKKNKGTKKTAKRTGGH